MPTKPELEDHESYQMLIEDRLSVMRSSPHRDDVAVLCDALLSTYRSVQICLSDDTLPPWEAALLRQLTVETRDAEPDQTPEQWLWIFENGIECAMTGGAKRDSGMKTIRRILAQGKRQERERIVKELVEAGIVLSTKPIPRKGVDYDHYACPETGVLRDGNKRVDRHNAILRIVNPDAEE